MYYLIETDYFAKPTAYRTTSLTNEFKFMPSRWMTGNPMGNPKQPLEVEFWQNGGDGLAEIFLDSIPLFSRELVDALQEAGADNLQLFAVTPVEKNGAVIHREYCAVNIIGCVRCADLDKSDYSDLTGEELIAVNFRKLVIDEEKANSQHIFRLAESVGSIVVHERIKIALDKKQFRYVSFRQLAVSQEC